MPAVLTSMFALNLRTKLSKVNYKATKRRAVEGYVSTKQAE
jgi:hypothetical protein